MANLRDKVIKLAYQKPELRKVLLPLVKTAIGGTYVLVKELPPELLRPLKSLGYTRRDIEIQPGTSYSPASAAGTGSRGFVCVVDMGTGKFKTEYGAWGGATPWDQRQVDLDTSNYPIPPNGAVIKGTEGGGNPVWAYIKVRPDNLAGLLPEKTDVTKEEFKALQAIKMKSGYRAEEFRRQGLGKYSLDNPLVKSLLDKGLIKTNAKGALMITLKGKNV